MSTAKPLALAAFFSLSLAHLAACGDDGGGERVDARPAAIDANGGQIDGAVAVIDAMPGIADATVGTPDAQVGIPDADLTAADATPMGPSDVIINEIVLDHIGNDTDEFVELKGIANTDYSGFRVLQIDGDQGTDLNPGIVLTNHPGCTTDASGYCTIAVNNNTFQNGSQTILLVEGGTYNAGTTDIDANDDGTIDNTPWTTLLDGVAIVNSGTDYGYAGNTILLKTVTGTGQQTQPVTFGGASRIPDGTDTNASADWTTNTPNITNTGITSGQARNTPAAVNSVEP